MIFSPLEQFNILSVYDFSVVNLSNLEVALTQILILVWYIFNLMPFLVLSTIYAYAFTISQSLWLFSTLNLLGDLCQTAMSSIAFGYYLGTLCGLVNQILITWGFSLIFDLPHIIFNLIYNFWSSSINIFGSDWNLAQGRVRVFEISESSALLQANLFLTSAPIGASLTNFYFLVESMLIGITSIAYHITIGLLFSLTAKDFSYVIFSLNTSTLWLLFGFCILIFLFSAIIRRFTVFPKNNWQTVMESFYGIVLSIVNENAGPKGLKHFPLIFTTFIIILTCNVLGMIPYSFTVTSHAIITFSTALAIFIGINILGILKNRYHFLSLFFPPGAPLALAPLLVAIELLSYVFRVLSLSIRLFANLMSGHTLLKILSTFAWASVSFGGLFLIPIGIIFLITGLEVAIAFLQAYIFSVLLCIYINDAFNLH